MKKKLCFSVALLLLLFTISGCQADEDIIGKFYSKSIESDNKYEPILLSPNGDYSHELFDNCTIFEGSDNNCKLEYYNKTILTGTFYKYATLKKRYVAIHVMRLTSSYAGSETRIKYSQNTYEIQEDYFFIFDSKEDKSYKCKSLDKFNQQCVSMGLKFETWYYRENKTKRTTYSSNCYIDNAGKYRGQTLYFNETPIFEGIISNVEISDNNLVFVLRIADSDFGPEFPNISNQGLNFNKYKSNKNIRATGFIFFKLKYYARITLNLDTGKFIEQAV